MDETSIIPKRTIYVNQKICKILNGKLENKAQLKELNPEQYKSVERSLRTLKISVYEINHTPIIIKVRA